MKPKHRYALISTGIIAFIILAPLIVLFTTGTRYDFKTHRFLKTGVLVAQTSPKGAQIYLNGKYYGTTPKQIRFLSPGSYAIKISKPGYFDWQKRLEVNTQYVTYANLNLKSLILFFSSPQKTPISDDVLNFFAGNNRLVYLTSNEINIAGINSPNSVTQVPLPANFTSSMRPKIIPSPDENYFVISDGSEYLLLDAQKNTAVNISSLLSGTLAEKGALQFSSSDALYALARLPQGQGQQSPSLFQINWQANSKTKILENASAFVVSGNAIYYISANPEGGTSLLRAQMPSMASAALASNLPAWDQAQIFISPQNQIFILGDSSLYAVSQNLRHISDFVGKVQILNASSVLYATGNEIDLYNPATQAVSFVTRSTEAISNPTYFPDYGWVFFMNQGKIQAIEIDNRDTQNNYIFTQAKGLDSKYYVTSDASRIFYQSGGHLAQLIIR